jgi:hypothetical protein
VHCEIYISRKAKITNNLERRGTYLVQTLG